MIGPRRGYGLAGCLVEECQSGSARRGVEQVATAGCLVSDGHTMYVLTSRHVCGDV